MAEFVRITKVGTYAELGDESVAVTKAGAYAELSDESVLISKFGVYAELDNGQIRITKLGAYAELITPAVGGFVTGQNGLRVYYNNQNISQFIQVFSLESNVKIADPSVFTATGLQQPTLPMWLATMSGLWGRGLDDIFGAEVVGRGSSSIMYNFRVELGRTGAQAVYTWVAAAFVGSFKPSMNIDDAMVWSAAIALSGNPSRGVSNG